MTTDQFVYFDLPEPQTVWRWLAWGFVAALTLAIFYLAATA